MAAPSIIQARVERVAWASSLPSELEMDTVWYSWSEGLSQIKLKSSMNNIVAEKTHPQRLSTLCLPEDEHFHQHMYPCIWNSRVCSYQYSPINAGLLNLSFRLRQTWEDGANMFRRHESFVVQQTAKEITLHIMTKHKIGCLSQDAYGTIIASFNE